MKIADEGNEVKIEIPWRRVFSFLILQMIRLKVASAIAFSFACGLTLFLLLRHLFSHVAWTVLLPSHYRSLVLAVLVLWLWGINVQLLERRGISTARLLRLRDADGVGGPPADTNDQASDTSSSPDRMEPPRSALSSDFVSRHHRDVYQLAFVSTLIVGGIIWIANILPAYEGDVMLSDKQPGVDGRPQGASTSVENSNFTLSLNDFATLSFTFIVLLILNPFRIMVRKERYRFLRYAAILSHTDSGRQV